MPYLPSRVSYSMRRSGTGILFRTTRSPCRAAISGRASVPSLRDLAIDFSLQFIIENYAEIPPAFLDNPSCLFLIEAIEVCVVIGFSGFDEAVVDGLVFRDEAVCAQQAMPSFGECQQFARICFRAIKRSFAREPLANEVLHVTVGHFRPAAVGMLARS